MLHGVRLHAASGLLAGVGPSLARGMQQACAECGRQGATVRCRFAICRVYYHFPCSLRSGAHVSLASLQATCARHHRAPEGLHAALQPLLRRRLRVSPSEGELVLPLRVMRGAEEEEEEEEPRPLRAQARHLSVVAARNSDMLLPPQTSSHCRPPGADIGTGADAGQPGTGTSLGTVTGTLDRGDRWMRVGALSVRHGSEHHTAAHAQLCAQAQPARAAVCYSARRLHWSTRTVGARCLYSLTVRQSPGGTPRFCVDVVKELLAAPDEKGPQRCQQEGEGRGGLCVAAAAAPVPASTHGGSYINASSADEAWAALEERIWSLRHAAGVDLRHPGGPCSRNSPNSRQLSLPDRESCTGGDNRAHGNGGEQPVSKRRRLLLEQRSDGECARTQPFLGGRGTEAGGGSSSSSRRRVTRCPIPSSLEEVAKVAGPSSAAVLPGFKEDSSIVGLPLAMQYGTMRRDAHRRLSVRRSSIHGRGLFAVLPWKQDELVVEYVGEVVRSKVSDIREARYKQQGIGCYFFGLPSQAGAEDLVLDATRRGNAARYINHSCSSNLYARAASVGGAAGAAGAGQDRRKLLIFAKCTIRAGDELTLNYMFSSGKASEDRLLCSCGAPNCRGYLD
eukprot:jgi/Mesen1/3977/ME000210S03220